jgi:nucleoside-diphosphate-sugar epimerase
MSIPKILQISTSSVYGENAISSEGSICMPNNPYGVTKLAAENLLAAHALYFPLDYKIFRLFSVYGPNQRPDMGINKFLSQIHNGEDVIVYGDGNQTRDFTYVDDLTSTILKTLFSWDSIEEKVFNISGGREYSVNQLVSLCEGIIGRKAKIIHMDKPIGDQMNTKSTSTLALNKLDHKPETDLTTGLQLQYQATQF